jgi:hypothetical protein
VKGTDHLDDLDDLDTLANPLIHYETQTRRQKSARFFQNPFSTLSLLGTNRDRFFPHTLYRERRRNKFQLKNLCGKKRHLSVPEMSHGERASARQTLKRAFVGRLRFLTIDFSVTGKNRHLLFCRGAHRRFARPKPKRPARADFQYTLRTAIRPDCQSDFSSNRSPIVARTIGDNVHRHHHHRLNGIFPLKGTGSPTSDTPPGRVLRGPKLFCGHSDR